MASITQKLGGFLSDFASRYAPAFITLLLLAGGFYFYFTVIVTNNETDLKERNFRGLQRMATNIANKVDDYAERNTGNFLTALSNTNNPAEQALLKTEYDLENLSSADSAIDTKQRFSVKFIDGWKLLFRGNKVSGSPAGNRYAIAYASAEKFAAPLLRRDIFKYYLLAVGDSILFDELNISHQRLSEFLPGKFARDSVKKEQIQSGEIREVNIGGKEYKLFKLSFISGGNQKFTIGGYLPLDTYYSQQRYIPTYALLWLLIGIMLVMLMFPLLKIFLIQRSEQLLVSNAITSMASLHVIGAIVVLVAINSYVYFNLVLSSANNNLKDIARETAQNFTNELDSALAEIDSVQSLVSNTLFLKDSIIPLQNARNRAFANEVDTLYKVGSRYPYFKHISWVDSSGMQKFRWTTGTHKPRKINVSDRDYFKAIKSGNTWIRNGRSYYITGVSSWVSTEKLAVISTPFYNQLKKGTTPPQKDTNGLLMVTLGSPFRSMFKALLPEGYGFCIVKESGDVLFHDDENRSLNENLIEECTDNETMQSLLRTRSAGFTASSYSGSSQRFYVRPIPGMPYSVMAYREMRTIWAEGLDVISACSILCLMNLAIILLAVIIIQASEYRQSLLKGQSLLFTWLRPKMMLHDAYRSVSVFYWFSMMLQCLAFLLYTDTDQLCLVGISFSYSFLLLSYAYLQFAVINETDDEKKSRNKKPVVILTGFYLFTSLVFTLKLSSGQWMFIAAQLSLIGVGLLLAYKASLIKAIMKQKNFRWWYVLFLFSFVAASSITPLMNFYFLSFKEERFLSLKLNQLEFANKIMEEPVDTLAPKPDSLSFSYKAPYYFKMFADSIQPIKKARSPEDTVENRFEALYKLVKPSFSDHSREIDFLIKGSDSGRKDFYWRFYPKSDAIQFHYSMPKNQLYFDSAGISVYSTLKSDIDNTGKTIKEDWLSFLLLIGLLLLFLWGFNFLLNALVQKIFFQGFDNSTHFTESDVPFVNSLPEDENLFVNGPVNSGKFGMMAQYLSKKCASFQVVDIVRLATESTDDIVKSVLETDVKKNTTDIKCIVLLRHFELFMNDLAVTKKKLELMEALLKLGKQIIILSSRSFDSMLIKDEKEGPDAKDYTDRWSNVMNQFYNLYHRWKRPDNDDTFTLKMQTYDALLQAGMQRMGRAPKTKNSKMSQAADEFITRIKNYFTKRRQVAKEPDSDKAVRYLEVQLSHFFMRLDKECSHSDFLWSLRPSLLTYIKEHKKEFLAFDFQNGKPAHLRKIMSRHFIMLHEQICLKIQSLSANYYGAIWQSLTRDEQRTLYDIALDDMVNPNNRDIALRLGDLGLVKRLPDIACYEVMNSSFRNFIFTQLDKKEVDSLRADANDKGSWNSFQLPVLLVVIGIGIFLFTTQKDAFTNLLTYLGAAAGGIAALLKVLGMIPSSKN